MKKVKISQEKLAQIANEYKHKLEINISVYMILQEMSARLIKPLEPFLESNGDQVRELKMCIGDLRSHTKAIKVAYDKLSEIAVTPANADDAVDMVDAYINDVNVYLKYLLYFINAHHGCSEKEMLQLQSLLKLMNRRPIFSNDDIDKLTK